MGWATHYIEKLMNGETVSFRPRGNSMRGKVESGQLVTVEPISGSITKGSVVLCRVKGREYLHIVQAVQEGKYLIGNNVGGTNGWTPARQIFGILIAVE